MLKNFKVAIILSAVIMLMTSPESGGQVFTPPPKPKPTPPKPKPSPPKPVPNPAVVVRSKPAQPIAVGGGVTDIPLNRLSVVDTYTRSSLPANSWGGEQAIITGGWGDLYDGFLRFDINRLPRLQDGETASLRLFNTRPNSKTTPTNIKVYRAEMFVTNDLTYSRTLKVDGQSEKWVYVNSYDQWVEIDITDYFNDWKNGTANNGIAIAPVSSNNNFNSFVSSDSISDPSHRPILRIVRNSPVGDIQISSDLIGTWQSSVPPSNDLNRMTLVIRNGEVNADVGVSTQGLQLQAPCTRSLTLSEVFSANELIVQEVPVANRTACQGYYRAYIQFVDGQLDVNWYNPDNGKLVMSTIYARMVK